MYFVKYCCVPAISIFTKPALQKKSCDIEKAAKCSPIGVNNLNIYYDVMIQFSPGCNHSKLNHNLQREILTGEGTL